MVGGVAKSLSFLAIVWCACAAADSAHLKDVSDSDEEAFSSRNAFEEAEADAKALADAQDKVSSQAQAEAQAQTYGQGLAQSQAQSQAHVGSIPSLGPLAGGGWTDAQLPSQVGNEYAWGGGPLDREPLNAGLSNAQASASASAQANSVFGQGGSNPEAEAVPTSFKANAQSAANAITMLRPRLVPKEEYILPGSMLGHESDIHCREVGEIYTYNLRDACLICVCVQDRWYRTPQAVCVSCDSCKQPGPDFVPTLPPPPPESVATCSPLPNNTPFQNPLNPCQICICRMTYDINGKPDVQIQCEENPQCVLPHDTTTLAPSRDPVPLPLCNRFPQGVWFPHPNLRCQVCRCTTQMYFGVPQPSINCYPNPQCDAESIKTTPKPPKWITTEDPISWPPSTTPATIDTTPKGPLPGDKPHQSCRPYPPNQMFQHPWDSCQTCMCSESYGMGVVNVEVNCYTKKECCVEPPTDQFPGQTDISKIRVIDPMCKARGLRSEFLHPSDRCKICSCERFGSLITVVCKKNPSMACRGIRPPSKVPVTFVEPKCRNRLPNVPFTVSGKVCVCQEVYSYVVAKCTPILNWGSVGNMQGGNSFAQASAESSAISNNLNYGAYPGLVATQPGAIGQSQANAQAEAIANMKYLNYQTGPGNLYQEPLSGYLPQVDGTNELRPDGNWNGFPYDAMNPNAISNAIASAKAKATYENQFQPTYPAGGPLNSVNANPWNAQPYGFENNGLDGLNQPNQLGLWPAGQAQASAIAEAQAKANANALSLKPSQFPEASNWNSPLPPPVIQKFPFDKYPFILPGASAAANAEANALASMNGGSSQASAAALTGKKWDE